MDLYDAFSTETPLKIGDCVTVKEELRRDSRYPLENSFGIITRVLDKPVYTKKGKESGSLIEHEPLTTGVLFFVDDNNASKGAVEFFYNKSKLTPVYQDTCGNISLYKKLCAAKDAFLAVDKPFVPGDIVMWKPGFSNKLRPDDVGVGVVVEVVPEPRFNYTEETSSTNNLFYEPLDLIVGTLGPDGDLITFPYDSRRFIHAPQEIIDKAKLLMN